MKLLTTCVYVGDEVGLLISLSQLELEHQYRTPTSGNKHNPWRKRPFENDQDKQLLINKILLYILFIKKIMKYKKKLIPF